MSKIKYRMRDDLVQQSVGSEVLVYDPVSQTCHCLDRDNAAVLNHCRVAQTSASLAKDLGLAVEAAEEKLSSLACLGVLVVKPRTDDAIGRREALELLSKGVGVGIMTMALSQPAAAQSCQGAPCSDAGPVGAPCNPPNCATYSYYRLYKPFFSSFPDAQLGINCATQGYLSLSSCGQGLNNATYADCNQAKTAALQGGNDNIVYGCYGPGATCVSAQQCAGGAMPVGSPCCKGGTCRDLGGFRECRSDL